MPSFNGKFGQLDDARQIVPARTARPGQEHAWSRWRMGPQYPDVFASQAFPMTAVEPFLKAVRPIVSDDPEGMSRALIELLDKIGPAVVVTHSNGGLWGWLTAARSPNVRAVIGYEPGFVVPRGEAPPPQQPGSRSLQAALACRRTARQFPFHVFRPQQRASRRSALRLPRQVRSRRSMRQKQWPVRNCSRDHLSPFIMIPNHPTTRSRTTHLDSAPGPAPLTNVFV